MWGSLSYKSCTPYVTIVLGILSMITLGWIAICQQKHIQKLGETIPHLCTDSPFNDEDQADRVSESGQHWDWIYWSETKILSAYLSHNEGYTPASSRCQNSYARHSSLRGWVEIIDCIMISNTDGWKHFQFSLILTGKVFMTFLLFKMYGGPPKGSSENMGNLSTWRPLLMT